MEVLQIVGLGIIVAVFAVMLRQSRPEMALFLGLCFGIVVFLLVLGKMGAVLSVFRDLARRSSVDEVYLVTLLKIIGIAYITEFGAQICRDAGEGAVANKIELAGKILIIVLALPIFVAILEIVLRLLP